MLSSAIVGLLVVVFGWTAVDCGFVNNYKEKARLECPANQILSFIGSIHENTYEDRRWQFGCKRAPGVSSGCYWTHYLNKFHQKLEFNCPGDEVLNGMISYNDNRYEDRMFKIQCCRIAKRSLRNCYKTWYVNEWDGEMDFRVPDGQVINGVFSVYNNRRQDRRWRIYLCDLV